MTTPQTKIVAIVGGGIAGLAAGHHLLKARPDWDVRLFEKEAAAGGKIQTSQHEGYTFDWGPNGFLTNVTETLELAKELGLEQKLQRASPAAKHRYLYKNGKLIPLPSSPPAFIKTELLSVKGKLRAALELMRGRRVDTEETVYAFLARHFGRELAEVFADAAVSGITAGDPKQLSLDALFPRFRALEREHGSLLKGMIKAQQQAKNNPRPDGRLTSFEGGIGTLIGALEKKLAPHLNLNTEVKSLKSNKEGYELELSTGEIFRTDKVLLATPAFVSGRLLGPLYPEAARALQTIPYADVSVFGLGYDRIDIPRPLDGFGFLVPRGEGLDSLGVLWSSSIFPGQAPEGKVMLRVICGGVQEPDFINLSEDEALERVRRDLRLSMGITAEPEFYEYIRWPKGIPQYLLGHRQRVEKVRETLAPSLAIVGNAYDGVGVNDAVRSANLGVARLVNHGTET